MRILKSPYADCLHPKSFSLREKDFPYRTGFSPLALRVTGQQVRAENEGHA